MPSGLDVGFVGGVDPQGSATSIAVFHIVGPTGKLTASTSFFVPAGYSLAIDADLYGAGGGGAGGGNNLGGATGGGGGCTPLKATVTGPATVDYIVGAGGAGGAYGYPGIAGGHSYIQVTTSDGTITKLAQACGGSALGVINLNAPGGGGTYIGGTNPNPGSPTYRGPAYAPYSAGPNGDGSLSAAGAGALDPSLGRAGYGSNVGSGGNGDNGGAGSNGYIVAR